MEERFARFCDELEKDLEKAAKQDQRVKGIWEKLKTLARENQDDQKVRLLFVELKASLKNIGVDLEQLLEKGKKTLPPRSP